METEMNNIVSNLLKLKEDTNKLYEKKIKKGNCTE